MLNSKKLISMARKWKKLASVGRKRISLPEFVHADKSSSPFANKGHFIVYTCDKKRFVIPLAYLANTVFREILKIAEEEFGIPSDGPITLPCDAIFMEYVISLLGRCVSNDIEKALLISVRAARCSTSSLLNQGRNSQQLLVQSF